MIVNENLLDELYVLLRDNGYSSESIALKSVIFSIKSNNQKNFLNSFKENIIWGGAGSLIDLDFRDVKMNQKKELY